MGGEGAGGSGPGTGRLHPWKVTLAADAEPLQEAHCQAALGKRSFFLLEGAQVEFMEGSEEESAA